MEVSGQLHDSAALPLGKCSRYPLVRKLGGGGGVGPVGTGGQLENSTYFAPAGN
jgi:hypothetical protein